MLNRVTVAQPDGGDHVGRNAALAQCCDNVFRAFLAQGSVLALGASVVSPAINRHVNFLPRIGCDLLQTIDVVLNNIQSHSLVGQQHTRVHWKQYHLLFQLLLLRLELAWPHKARIEGLIGCEVGLQTPGRDAGFGRNL